MNNNDQNGIQSLGIVILFLGLMGISASGFAAATTPATANVNKTVKQSATVKTAQKKPVSKTDSKAVTNTPASPVSSTVTQDAANQDVSDSDDAVIDDGSMGDEASYSKDPLEGFNRAIFTFNDKFDIYFMKPIAELYNAIIPKPLNQGIHNVFNNLGELPTIANDLLQFNFYQMTKDTARLTINTTMGIGGLFDMATRMHLPYFQNDFGLTLAYWGYKDSSYLVLPFLGSNTIRDGIFGITVDYYGFSVYPHIRPESRIYQVLALYAVDRRANLLQFEPVFEEAAIDKYVFMRNAYMQHRAFQMEQIKHLSYKDRNDDAPVTDTVEATAGG